MVFYFTATGNSLQVARVLDSQPVSIPQIIHREKLSFSDESIGIVYPNHGSSQPPMVREFLRRARLETDYFYMVATYGKRSGMSIETARALCEECGLRLDYFRTVLMVDNYLPNFDMEEQLRMDKHVVEQLAALRSDVAAQKRYLPPVSEEEREAHKRLEQKRRDAARSPQPDYAHGAMFAVSDACVGCGVCALVCPEGDYRVENGRSAHTGGFCQQCLSCVHNCPVKAIGLTVPEKNPNARYRNGAVSLEDIIRSNRQM